jgi:hypothetical protein
MIIASIQAEYRGIDANISRMSQNNGALLLINGN